MVKEPESMDELIYFTKRAIGEGFVKAWVYKGMCPECGKGLMGKPVDKKTGKVKIRSKEYICPECKHTAEKEEYEATLTCEATYTCPKCKFEGETENPFRWKNTKIFNENTGKDAAVKAIKFNCGKCDEVILITKKMKG